MTHYFATVLKQHNKFDCIKDPRVLELEDFSTTPFHFIALLIFFLAVCHTLSVRLIHNWARTYELRLPPKRSGQRAARPPLIHLLYFLSEIEIVFAIWTIPLFFAIVYMYDLTVALDYINTRNYTEPLFVTVILSLTATRPIILLAEKTIQWIAKGLGGSLSAWWVTLLTVGPLLGSLITEVGAMTLCALLLSGQFYEYRPKPNLAYATIGLLFVNISVGGALSSFASPAVLILSHAWDWTSLHIFTLFGWKIIIGVCLSNILYWFYFRKEFEALNNRKKVIEAAQFLHPAKEDMTPIPRWVYAVHLIFITWIVIVSQYPAIFIASFLCFIGFHQTTRPHQYPIRLTRPLLVGLFLAGLVIHGGLQGWWILDFLQDTSPLSVMGMSIILAGFNDNAAIAYLATLIPNWSEVFKYAIFTGIIAGGGLTVIANAPNPAGYAILRHHFPEGLKPLKLLGAALIPTVIFYAIFYLLGPLFP
jgi:hypothetical protein